MVVSRRFLAKKIKYHTITKLRQNIAPSMIDAFVVDDVGLFFVPV